MKPASNSTNTLSNWFKEAVYPQRQIVATSTNDYRERSTPCDHELSFDQVNAPVLSLLKEINRNIDSGKRVLLAFDFDGTLTPTKIPDFSIISDLPVNIARALEKIAAHKLLKVRIITARGHDSIHHINLNQEIKRYSSDGQVSSKKLAFDKLQLDVEAGKIKYLQEAESIKEKALKDPVLRPLIESKAISIATGLGNFALTINTEDHSETNENFIKSRMSKILKNTDWAEWTKFKEKNNTFYYNTKLYQSNYDFKASGIRRITTDLQKEGFDPDLIACFGDSPNADTSMMQEVQSWNKPLELFRSINVAVGSRIDQDEESLTHRVKSHEDIYELILGIANNLS